MCVYVWEGGGRGSRIRVDACRQRMRPSYGRGGGGVKNNTGVPAVEQEDMKKTGKKTRGPMMDGSQWGGGEWVGSGG